MVTCGMALHARALRAAQAQSGRPRKDVNGCYGSDRRDFRRSRAENYELIRELPEAAWSRPYVHSQYGPNTLLGLLKTYTEHAENHVMQLRTVRQAYKDSKK